MTRTRLAQFGLLVLLAFSLVGCQQQAGVGSATPVIVISTPTVAPSPTPGERIFIDASYPCGPLFVPSNLGLYRLVLAWTPDGTHLVFNYLPVDEVARGGGVCFRLHCYLAGGCRRQPLGDAG